MNPALLVIDLQNWFFQISVFQTHEGRRQLANLVTKTNELIEFFRDRDLPILHILTVHKADGSTRDLWAQRNDSWVLIEGSPDVEELSDIKRFPSDIIIHKTRSSSYLNTNLQETLRSLNIDTVVISGYSTNKCIGMAAIESVERDFDVLVSSDAILGPREDRVQAMLSVMEREFGVRPVSNQVIRERLFQE